MKVDIYKKNVTIDQITQDHLEHKIKNIQKRFKRYHPDASHLTIRLSRNNKKDLFICSLELNVFNKILYAKKYHSTILSAIKQSFEAIIRSFEKYRLKINKCLQSKKKHNHSTSNFNFLSAEKTIKDTEWKKLFHDTVQKKLNQLFRLVRHEIIHLQLVGKREPGELLPQDVIDETILRVYRSGEKNMTESEIEYALIRTIYEVTSVLSNQLDERREKEISFDKQIEEISEKDKVSTLGEEMLYFYEPDEVLRVEDIVTQDGSMGFEDTVEEDEIQKKLYQIINRFPASVRKVFILLYIEEYYEEEVALLLNKSLKEIKALKKQASERLAELLQVDENEISWQELFDVFRQLKFSELDPYWKEKYELDQFHIIFLVLYIYNPDSEHRFLHS